MKTATHAGASLHPMPLLAVLLWGGIYPGAKVALEEIPGLSFTALRLLLAVAVLFAVSWGTRPFALPRRLYRPLLNAGLAQLAFQFLLVAGLQRTTAGNSAILLATAPLLTALWLLLVRRDRPTARQALGLLLGLVGVTLIIGGVRVGGGQFAGDLLALGSAAAWVWYGLAIGPLVRALGAIRATAWAMLIGALLFLPLAAPQLRAQAWADVSWGAWAGVVYGATAGMAAAMVLWGRSVGRLGPRRTMLYAYLEPVSAVALAALILGEAFTLQQAAGALLAFAGVWLAS